MKTKNIVVLLLTFCLALGMAACTTRSDAEMPRQMQEFTEETLAPEVPAQEQAVPRWNTGNRNPHGGSR